MHLHFIKKGIQILGLIRTNLWAQKSGAQDVAYDFLKCLPVPLIHRQKEKRQHQPNHEQNCRFISNMGAGKQVRWHANESRNRKANELSPRQIKCHLGFYLA